MRTYTTCVQTLLRWRFLKLVDAYYGSRTSLADQGNLGVAGESGAFVEPSWAGLVAAGPGIPVDDKPPGQGPAGEPGERVHDLGDGQRDHAGLRRWWLIGPDRRGCPGAGAVAQ